MKYNLFFLILSILTIAVTCFAQPGITPMPASEGAISEPRSLGVTEESPIVDDPLTEAELEKLPSPEAVTDLIAYDTPNDAGGSITLEWMLPEQGIPHIDILKIYRSSKDTDFIQVAKVPPKDNSYVDRDVKNHVEYRYMIESIGPTGTSVAYSSFSVKASGQWFDSTKVTLLISVILFSFFIIYNINRAKQGADLYIRPIGGLLAVDEAIGRATEMGKPTLYVPGIMDMDDVQTIAGVGILSHVSKKCAEYDTPIHVPCSRSIVMSACQEVVKEAYIEIGRPDAYNSDNIRYLTDDQFGFAAGVDGIMLREKPAANFFLGKFYAESLILAETGNSVGAIQIAGTAESAQLPFFVTACDYTLIGEELFAASAYLSNNPLEQGSLKGQDWGKFLIMIMIVLGILVETFWPGSFSAIISQI